MMRLPAVLFLAMAWLTLTANKPLPSTGPSKWLTPIPAPEAGRVESAACVVRLGAATAELSAKLTAHPDDRFRGRVGQTGFFNEKRFLQDR